MRGREGVDPRVAMNWFWAAFRSRRSLHARVAHPLAMRIGSKCAIGCAEGSVAPLQPAEASLASLAKLASSDLRGQPLRRSGPAPRLRPRELALSNSEAS